MKKIVASSLLATSALLYADMSQQEFLYKDPRIMGMGAANTAVGGYSTAVFYNPAGLINIKKSHGVEVELLTIGVAASKNIQNFVDDIDNAETEEEIIDAVAKHSGEGFNITASDYSSFSYHTQDDLAFSFGLLVSADINFIPHANSGENGLLETHSRGYGGVVGGVAKRYEDAFGFGGKLTVGLGLKYITQKSYEAGLDSGELYEHQDDLATYIQETYEQDNSGFGVDIGVLYELPIFSSWHPVVGLSLMNIGTLNFDDAYGAQPMTINAGIAVTKELAYINSITLSMDYVDITNQQQARIHNYTTGASRTKDEYDNADIEYDMMQHIRIGAKAEVFDNRWVTTSLMGGFYQGAYTAGVDLQFAILKLQAATYQEQLGSVPGQIEDRRYMVGLGIGW